MGGFLPFALRAARDCVDGATRTGHARRFRRRSSRATVALPGLRFDPCRLRRARASSRRSGGDLPAAIVARRRAEGIGRNARHQKPGIGSERQGERAAHPAPVAGRSPQSDRGLRKIEASGMGGGRQQHRYALRPQLPAQRASGAIGRALSGLSRNAGASRPQPGRSCNARGGTGAYRCAITRSQRDIGGTAAAAVRCARTESAAPAFLGPRIADAAACQAGGSTETVPRSRARCGDPGYVRGRRSCAAIATAWNSSRIPRTCRRTGNRAGMAITS